MRHGTFPVIRPTAFAAALLAAGLVPAQAPPAPPPADPKAVAATVNGETISLGQVDAVILQRPPAAPLTPAQVRRLREGVASDLADDLLLRQFLRRHGPAVEPAEVERHYKAFTEGLARQGRTAAGFLRETGQTEGQVRETWAVLFQLAGYVKERVTDEQLKAYYTANKDVFDRVEARVSHIVVRAGAAAAEREAARRKLTALRGEIAAGRLTFADAARRHSQCPTAPQGGDLGYLVRKGMLTDEAFCKAAFALPVGECSDAVETEDGFHLIMVADRKPGTPSAFERCRDEVREVFTDDFRTELIGKLRRQAQVRLSVP